MMKYQNKIGIRIFYALSIILLLYGIIKTFYYDKKINGEGRYTIGLVESVEGTRGGQLVKYSYKYNGNIYYGGGTYQAYKKYIGKLFFVKFWIKNSKASEILLNNPVPDSVHADQLPGWPPLPL